jgi:hypothetical protein
MYGVQTLVLANLSDEIFQSVGVLDGKSAHVKPAPTL